MDGKNHFLKTKIVCTLGPSSSDEAILRAMCEAGMDVARLNLAHGTADAVRDAARRVRECARTVGKTVALLGDIQGSKIRVGELTEPVTVVAGDRIILAPEEIAESGELPISYTALAVDLSEGDRILIDDGQIELRTVGLRPPRIETEVAVGGTVRPGKGINLPGVYVSAPALTEKDLLDLELALGLDVDYLALSFVRRPEDIKALKDRIPPEVLVIAKIEKDEALENLEGILKAADAVMVARGDLGAELPFEQVPLVQKRLVRMANTRFRPVIIATEMLESMIERPRPTRAEISDVANALLDGTDAVMLAAETATGRFPVESVRAIKRVIEEIESSAVLAGGPAYDVPAAGPDLPPVPTEVAVAGATVQAVRLLDAPAVVTFTKSGFTARVVSSRRPPVPILAVTDTERVCRQLALVWGVRPLLCPDESTYDNMWAAARAELLRHGLGSAGDRVVVTAGVPFHVHGTSNMVRIETM